MIIELRSLLPASEEEERSRRSVKNGSGAKHEAEETPVVEVALPSAEPRFTGRDILQDSGEESSKVRRETMKAPAVKVEIRSAEPLRTPSSPSAENLSLPASVPASSPVPEKSPSCPAYEGSGGSLHDDRIPALLERLLSAAERTAAFSERIADLMERQSSEPAPVYA